jgi:hypothetical protein
VVKVLINSGPITATYPLREVPQEKWGDLMLARRSFLEINLSYDCRCLVEFVNDAKLMFKTLGFTNAEHMIRDGYKLEPDEINIAVEWLKLNPPKEPISLEEAKKLGAHGGDRGNQYTGGKSQADNISLPEYGTSRAYILTRLDRAHTKDLARKKKHQINLSSWPHKSVLEN